MRTIVRGGVAVFCVVLTFTFIAAAGEVLQQSVQSAAGTSSVPTGTVVAYAGVAAPAGYVVCDGSLYPSSKFERLSTALQKTFCTAAAPCGANEFRVPNLSGRVVVGTGTGPGLSMRGLGDSFGEETHLLTIDEMPSHSHKIGRGVVINFGGPGSELTRFEEPGRPEAFTYPVGGNQRHNVMQPSFVLTYIIKD